MIRNDDSKSLIVTISIAIARIYAICILAYTLFLPDIGVSGANWTTTRWRHLFILLAVATLLIVATLIFARKDCNRGKEGVDAILPVEKLNR